MLIGYARVSTSEQETALQRDALELAGVNRVYEEKASSVGARPELRRAVDSMARGDTLVVWKFDRLARGVLDLLSFVKELTERGCFFRSLTEPIDTSTPIGEYLFTVLGANAQLERKIIRERVIAGQVAAIQRGGRHGRPPALTDEKKAEVLRLWFAGGMTMKAIADHFGVGRSVVERVIFIAENPGHPRYGPKRPVLGPMLDGMR